MLDDMVHVMPRHRSIYGFQKKGSMGRISGSAQRVKTSSGGGGIHQSTVDVGFHVIEPTLRAGIQSLGNPK
jgi:hypothetical protein